MDIEKLENAFNNEAVSHVKLMIYSDKAKEEGFSVIGDTLHKIANQDLEHAKIWMNELGELGDTEMNLRKAVETQQDEINMYTDWQNQDDSVKLKAIIEAEKAQLEELTGESDKMDTETIYINPTPCLWYCTNCGFIGRGKRAPLNCPLCGYPQGYFKRWQRITDDKKR